MNRQIETTKPTFGYCRPVAIVKKSMAFVTLIAFASMLLVPPPVLSQTTPGTRDAEIARRFEDVMVLKSRGEFDRAIVELNEMIEDYADSEQVLRLSYSYLVAVYHEKKDIDGARRIAAEALEKYPDIKAKDIITVPPSVDGYYDVLRSEMFGSLSITEPKDCDVYLNGRLVGEAPLQLNLVRVGEYDLTLSKSGYHDYTERIVIQPSGNLVKTIQMKRARSKWWWITRVGIPVVAAGVVALALIGDGDSPPPDLGAPPKPPE